MLGFSVYLGNNISKETENYIRNMKQAGFQGIFSSLHIPEDDISKYLMRLKKLGALAISLDLKLMVDISEKSLRKIGLNLRDTDAIKAIGITGLRMDDGIPMSEVAKCSQTLVVGLNASTLTVDEVDSLKKNQADFTQLELWHNYYPRIETGLEKESFIKRNLWLKGLGLKIIAFAPGDDQLRGPLHMTLPTLEKHRGIHPLAATIELLEECEVDHVYIGDEALKGVTCLQMTDYIVHKRILLTINLLSKNHLSLIIGEHQNRIDEARDVIRSRESRFKKIPIIEAESTITRRYGAVTLDNKLYQRYMGEMQIVKRDLPSDHKVNVIGQVISTDLELIHHIKSGRSFYLQYQEEK